MNINRIHKIVKERERRKEKSARIKSYVVLAVAIFMGIFVGNFFSFEDFSITGFVTNGTLPTVGGDSGNWGTVLNDYLQQEHTENGSHKNVSVEGDLNVSGNINVTGNIVADNLTDSSGGIISIPSGAVMYFNSTVCPSGWTEDTLAKGRYLVGLNISNGTLEGTIGTALIGPENRSAGIHSHADTIAAATESAHTHSTPTYNSATLGNQNSFAATNQAPPTAHGEVPTVGNSGHTHTITGGVTDNTGTAGTNAPYIQYLICIKT